MAHGEGVGEAGAVGERYQEDDDPFGVPGLAAGGNGAVLAPDVVD